MAEDDKENEVVHPTQDFIDDFEELVKKQEGIIEEMKLAPGGEYYEQAKTQFEERIKN